LRFLRGYGVNASHIQSNDTRMGIYFLEAGANQRPSAVVYDREQSAMALARADDFDWNAIFAGATWFHVTCITPAISATAAQVTLTAVRAAHAHGLTVSCDNSYRSKLWQYGKTPREVMPEIVQYVNVLFANEEDCRHAYGVSLTPDETADINDENERMTLVGQKMFAAFPNLTHQAFTLRQGFSASHNGWSACLYNGRELLTSPYYDITHIVDRVGGGDAFAAGLIYGLYAEMNEARALHFATAAACLKHSIYGDINLVSVAEVENLMQGDASGRVQR
jgi:2-dehydro-3-deoxygluconokinase